MTHTLRVLFSLGPFAVAFIRDRRRWLFWGAPIPRTPEEHERRARRLVATIVRLGPTFVKMAQVFAARADLIPEPYLGELGTLIDQVPPMPFAVVERTVRESYERGVDEVFESFERTPVAAASLGQVHRARWHGEVVAVKVLRPNVEANVAADLRASRQIQRWVERWWNHPHVKRVRVVLDEFELRIAEEMDFRLEAEHATEIRANFANNRDVVVPRVMHELTRQRVLEKEFVEGTRIDRLDAAHVDVPHVLATLVELYVQIMLVDGLFHADPHPGNLMLAADGRIVLLDFGMVVRVPLEVRRTLMRTSIAAIRRDPDAVAQGFQRSGADSPGYRRSDSALACRAAHYERILTDDDQGAHRCAPRGPRDEDPVRLSDRAAAAPGLLRAHRRADRGDRDAVRSVLPGDSDRLAGDSPDAFAHSPVTRRACEAECRGDRDGGRVCAGEGGAMGG